MTFLIVYLIIGVGLLTYSGIKQAQDGGEDFVKNELRSLHWWVAWILCVIFWPLLVGWAVYDAVKELQNEAEAEL